MNILIHEEVQNFIEKHGSRVGEYYWHTGVFKKLPDGKIIELSRDEIPNWVSDTIKQSK